MCTDKMRKIAALVLLSVVLSPHVQAGDEKGSERGYAPYKENEFPLWARDLRRFEIIFFGTIPFSFFYASIGYSIYTYGSSGWDPDYAPALLGNSTPPVLTNDQKMDIVYIALGLSFTAAGF